MRLRRIPAPFDDQDYLFELKYDGFRAVVYLENGECRLVSRNLKNLKFESLKKELTKLPVQNLLGRARGESVQRALRPGG